MKKQVDAHSPKTRAWRYLLGYDVRSLCVWKPKCYFPSFMLSKECDILYFSGILNASSLTL